MANNETNDSTEHYNNLDLIYEYTGSILKAVNDDTNTINAKLGTVIAFNGVLIRVAMDLPDRTLIINRLPCYTCLIIKVLVFSLLIASVWVSTSGLLTPGASSSVVKPSELLENWYGEESEVCKLFILKGLSQAVEGLDEERERKAKQLRRAIQLLATTVTLFAIGSLLPIITSGM